MDRDKLWMRKALELAKKGEGKVNPNPLVGAVIVKDEKVIGEGYHKIFGGPHAEVNAVNSAVEDISGSTLYVTLEPCSHFGKTPPCADLIISKNISKVVIGLLDPNPLVAGRGIKKLLDAGIEVKVGVLEEECKKINESFLKYISEKRPFVLMKSAMTLDGKIATKTGDSKWISNETSRQDVQKLRNKYSSIMVGINTVLKDDPLLTCRLENGVNPTRVIVDSFLRIPIESNIVKTAKEVKTIVATTKNADSEKRSKLESLGVEVLSISEKQEKVNLHELMKILGEKGIDSVLLEGGGTLNYSALEEGIVDKVKIYIAPMILGGDKSKSIISGLGVEAIKDAFKLKNIDVTKLEDDIVIEAYIRRN